MAKDPRPAWAKALTTLRLIRRWNRRKLAQAAGLSASAITRYEKGDRGTVEDAIRLGFAMGFPHHVWQRVLEFVVAVEGMHAGQPSTPDQGANSSIEAIARTAAKWTEALIKSALTTTLVESRRQLNVASVPAKRQPARSALAGRASHAKRPAAAPSAPPATGEAIVILRMMRSWERQDLADAIGRPDETVANYEYGRTVPNPQVLRALLAVMDYPLAALEAAIELVHMAREAHRLSRDVGRDRQSAEIATIAAQKARRVAAFTRGEMEELAVVARVLVSRDGAESLWASLSACSERSQHDLVRQLVLYQTPGFCELLCDESLKVAGDSARRAKHLAELAVLAAELATGSDAFRARLRGFAGAHHANALRVAGHHLPAAGAALDRALAAWNAGAGSDAGMLNAARVCGLLASMRRGQRLLPAAIQALDEGLRVDRWGETPVLRLAKARVLIEMGDFAASIDQLRRAESDLDGEAEPRRFYVIENLQVLNLCHLGQFAAAERKLASLRRLARSNRLDLLRVDWLAGKVAAGLRQETEALALLLQARAGFVEVGNAYDAALVTLELAEVQSSLGHTAEVKALARKSAPIFADQRVHREAQRALALFRAAAEEERVTSDLLRHLIVYLCKARHDPSLRFAAEG